MYTYQAYLIETLTNLHVGTGGEQIGIVDNQIQRDPVTGFPSIYGSSLKGSLLDHVKNSCRDSNQEIPDSDLKIIENIFGGRYRPNADEEPEKGADPEGKEPSKRKLVLEPGKVVFFDAHLLTLPLRASQKVYYNCTCPSVLDNFSEQMVTFKIPIAPNGKPSMDDDKSDFRVFDTVDPNLEIEDFSVSNLTPSDENIDSYLAPVAGIKKTNFALFQNDIFAEICKTGLPFIARNSLVDGISQNLWYEEFLPRRTRLWFVLGFPENYANTTWLEKKICKSQIVQIGANFSIGYGYCRIHKLPMEVKS